MVYANKQTILTTCLAILGRICASIALLTLISNGYGQAQITSEIKHNRFTIKTDKPNVKVSWLVTGIRLR